MKTRYFPVVLALAAVCILPVQAQGQYPMVDQVANKVIAKYQSASCDQLAAQKQQPPSGQKAAEMNRAMQMLKENPAMRTYFINKVAAPIANKLFDCGMIP